MNDTQIENLKLNKVGNELFDFSEQNPGFFKSNGKVVNDEDYQLQKDIDDGIYGNEQT